jgi:hypothetical protein
MSYEHRYFVVDPVHASQNELLLSLRTTHWLLEETAVRIRDTIVRRHVR